MKKLSIDINHLKKLYYDEHKSLRECAIVFNTGPSIIKDHLNRNGFICRKIGEHRVGVNPWNKGKSFSDDNRIANGIKNGHYNGGVSPIRESIRKVIKKTKRWMVCIFERDNYTCRLCGKRGGKLNAHHIWSFANILDWFNINTVEEALNNEYLMSINNGITLCEDCHIKIHQTIRRMRR